MTYQYDDWDEELFGPRPASTHTNTFEGTDPFREEPDTTSAFARAHTAQAAERLEKAANPMHKFCVGDRERSRALYEKLNPQFRELLEAAGGYERLRKIAKQMAEDEEAR